MLEELACDESSRLYDPRVSFESVMTEELDDEEYRSIYILVWRAYRECGFLVREIYSLLRDTVDGIQLPAADFAGGERVPDASAGCSPSPPLTPKDKQEIVRLRDARMPVREIAAKFKKTRRTIYDVLSDAEEKPASPDLTIVGWRR